MVDNYVPRGLHIISYDAIIRAYSQSFGLYVPTNLKELFGKNEVLRRYVSDNSNNLIEKHWEGCGINNALAGRFIYAKLKRDCPCELPIISKEVAKKVLEEIETQNILFDDLRLAAELDELYKQNLGVYTFLTEIYGSLENKKMGFCAKVPILTGIAICKMVREQEKEDFDKQFNCNYTYGTQFF